MMKSTTTSTKRSDEPVFVRQSRTEVVMLRLISGYRRLTAGRPSPCRFYPSCSSYAEEAIVVHGALRGSGLAIRRVLRCRPLGPHGVDLVPESKQARSS